MRTKGRNILFILAGFALLNLSVSCATSTAERKKCGIRGCEKPEVHRHPGHKAPVLKESREKNIRAEKYDKRIKKSKDRLVTSK